MTTSPDDGSAGEGVLTEPGTPTPLSSLCYGDIPLVAVGLRRVSCMTKEPPGNRWSRHDPPAHSPLYRCRRPLVGEFQPRRPSSVSHVPAPTALGSAVGGRAHGSLTQVLRCRSSRGSRREVAPVALPSGAELPEPPLLSTQGAPRFTRPLVCADHRLLGSSSVALGF